MEQGATAAGESAWRAGVCSDGRRKEAVQVTATWGQALLDLCEGLGGVMMEAAIVIGELANLLVAIPAHSTTAMGQADMCEMDCKASHATL